MPASDTPRGPSPRRYAATIAVTYFAFGALYIAGSGAAVARLAWSIEDLARLERMKGWGFIAVTALALFFFSQHLFRLLGRDALIRARQAEAARVLDRRALVGALAAAVAHDGNNELTVARVHAEILRRLVTTSPGRESLAEIEEALGRLAEMMRRLRDLGSQAKASESREIELVAEIRAIVARLRAHAQVRGCTITVTGERPVPIRGFPVLVAELVTNLVLNAAEATGGAGSVEIVVRASGDGPVVEVSDDGPGVPAELRTRVFEPFFTTKDEGTGLGLLSVRACVTAHRGRLELGESPAGGARFSVWLPGLP